MKSLLLALAMGLGFGSAQAQVRYDEVIDFDAVGVDAVAVVQDQYLISNNDGLTWRQQTRGITCSSRTAYGARTVALSPVFDKDGTAFLTCEGHVFRSTDRGGRYDALSTLPEHIADLKVSPEFAVDQTLLALLSDGRLFVSLDAGASWEAVDIAGLTSLAWVPGAILAGGADGRLYTSVDTIEWDASAPVSASGITAVAIPFNAGLDMPIFAGTNDGLVTVRLSRGTEILARHLAGHKITSLASQPGGATPAILAASWEKGIYRSTDWGATWEPVDDGLPGSEPAHLIKRPHFGSVHANANGTVFAGTMSGLYRSPNAGERWFRTDTLMGNIIALAVSPPKDGGFELAAMTYGSGILRSPNAGQSWTYDQAGLRSHRLSLSYAPGPGADHSLLSGGFGRMSILEVAGETWETVSLPKLHRSDGAEISAVPVTIAASPGYATNGTVLLALHPYGILKSTNFGKTYDGVFHGPEATRSLAFAENNTILANAGGAVIRSLDGGETWTTLWNSREAQLDLVLSPAYANDGMIFAGSPGGLYWSEDHGASWAHVAVPGTQTEISGLALSPEFAQDGLIYVQKPGQDLYLGTLGEGGFSWSAASIPAPGHVFTKFGALDGSSLLAFSPFFAEDQTIYGGAGRNLLRSTDAGATWEVMPTLPRRFEVEHGFLAVTQGPVKATGAWERAKPPETFTQATLRKLGDTWRRTFGGYLTPPGNASGLGALSSETAGATLSFDFVGRGVQIVGTRGPDRGVAHIHLNGQLFTSVDLYAPDIEYQSVIYQDHGMPLEDYTLQIEVAGEQSDASTGVRVDIDAIDTFP